MTTTKQKLKLLTDALDALESLVDWAEEERKSAAASGRRSAIDASRTKRGRKALDAIRADIDAERIAEESGQ